MLCTNCLWGGICEFSGQIPISAGCDDYVNEAEYHEFEVSYPEDPNTYLVA